MRNKYISLVLALSLLCQQSGILCAAGEINLANYLSQARNAIVQPDVFQPARLRYISYDVASNDFKLLLDKGDNINQKTEKLKNQKTLEFLNSQTPELNGSTQELFKYFLIGLALPNDTFWVNLRPDAPENIIDPLLEKTDIGKIFLEADLQLKKDTASLTSPQNPEGKAYWDKLYKKAGELFGTENITIPTITRPWIVPNEVIVRETEDSAYIYKATLKVMLEADYLQNQKTEKPKNQKTEEYGFSDPRLKELNEYSSQIIRETIIPKLTKEVNSSKRYAKLRQVYYSLVLARWFKQKYQGRFSGGKSLLERTVPGIDSGDLTNLTSREPCDKQAYFQAYQKSFKDGEYNLKEIVASPSGQSVRNYISGGIITEMDISILGNPGGELVTRALEDGLTPVDRAATFSGSPVNRDVRDDLREIYNNYSGVKSAIKIIELFINGNNKDENYIRYLEDTVSSLLVFEGVKDLHESLRMAYEIFYKANEHKQRNEEGELTQEISVKLNEKGFLDEFAELQKKMDRLKKDPYRLPWIKEILGQIDLFLYEFNDAEDPGTVSRLREIKKEIGDLTHYIDVNEKWKGGIREFLIDKTGQRTGNRRKAIKDAVEKIDEIIEAHQKDGDIDSGKTSASPIEKLRVYDSGSGKTMELSYVPAVELNPDERKKAAEQLELRTPKYSQGYHNIIIQELRNESLNLPNLYLAMDGEIVVGYIHKKEGLWIDAVAAPVPEIEIALTVKLIREMIEDVGKKKEGKITLLHNEPVTYDSNIKDWRKAVEVYKNLDIGKENKGPGLWIKVMGETLGQLQWLDENAAKDIVARYDKWLTQKMASSSISRPGKLIFWDGENREKRTLMYVRGDELGEDRREEILNNKPFFIEDKSWANGYIIKVMQENDKKSLSDIRFAFSDTGILEGYIVVFYGGNFAAISAVAGNTQWIETALIIAGMQELADISPQAEFVKLNNVSKDNPYQMIILKRLITGNKSYNPLYNSPRDLLYIKEVGLPGVYRRDIGTIIDNYSEYVLEEVENEKENSRIINKYSGSPLVLEEKDWETLRIIRNLAGVEGLLINKQHWKGSLMEKMNRICKYYAEEAGKEFKRSSVSKETELKLKQWRENKEDLEKILVKVTVDELKRKIIGDMGKGVKDLAGDSKLAAAESLDELVYFLKGYSDELSVKIKGRAKTNGKLRSDISALEAQRENGNVPDYAQEEKIKKLEKEISINSYYFGKISQAYEIVEQFRREISEISKLTGASSSAVMRKKDWDDWMRQVKGIIADADSLLYADFKIESGKMRSVEDVYDWMDEKLLHLQNKLKEGQERLSAERYTIYFRANGDRVKYYEERIGNLESIKQDIGKISAPFKAVSSSVGGIDLTDRFMRLKIERTGGFADLKLFLPRVQNAKGLDLDKEFRQVEAIVSSGIVPNSRRILELFSACYARGEFGQRLPQVISCLKASSAIQESLGLESDGDFRLCLLLPEIFPDGG